MKYRLAWAVCVVALSQSFGAWGRGPEQSYDTIRAAAEKGDAYAQAILAMKYRRGEDVPQNYVEAFKWAEQSANQNHPMGLAEMGNLYEEGLGVDTDEVKSLEFFRKAFPGIKNLAEKGDAEARLKLGLMYTFGRGVAMSGPKGEKWFQKAAQQGNAFAQLNLGLMHMRRGDDAVAMSWFQQSAEQGNKAAAEYLKRMQEAAELLNTFTVTSEPTGANVDQNGQFIGVTPFVSRKFEDFCFKAPDWVFSNYLGEPIPLRIWKDGYLPKEISVTRGPFKANFGQYGVHIYYIISSQSFHVKLQRDPSSVEVPKPVEATSPLKAPPVPQGVDPSIFRQENPMDVELSIPASTARHLKTLAVVIGNRAYKKMWEAQYAGRDAEWMKTYLIRRMGVAEGNVLFLSDLGLSDFQNVFGGQDGTVARSQLYRRLREKGWDVIVYFSGHGLSDPEDKSNYLLPIDANPDNISATAYRLDALYRNLRQLTDGKITVILEACFSGRTPKGQIGGKTSGVSIVDPKALAPQGIDILAAAKPDQMANWYVDQNHGLFTYYLMRALRGDADTDTDGKITGAEIKTYVTREVSAMSDRVGVAYQEPVIEVDPDWVWTE